MPDGLPIKINQYFWPHRKCESESGFFLTDEQVWLWDWIWYLENVRSFNKILPQLVFYLINAVSIIRSEAILKKSVQLYVHACNKCCIYILVLINTTGKKSQQYCGITRRVFCFEASLLTLGPLSSLLAQLLLDSFVLSAKSFSVFSSSGGIHRLQLLTWDV